MLFFYALNGIIVYINMENKYDSNNINNFNKYAICFIFKNKKEKI